MNLKSGKFFLILILIAAWIFSGYPQIWQNPPVPPEVQVVRAATTVTYSSAENTGSLTTNDVGDSGYFGKWTVPAGVTSVDVACWGGGGGGGDGTSGYGGGGGGGGAFASTTITGLSAGNSYTIFIGAGGDRATADGGNGSGGATTTFATTTVRVSPGNGGKGGSVDLLAGGTGGNSSLCTCDAGACPKAFSGGTGGAGLAAGDKGGGGGGAAGPHGVGLNGTNGAAGGTGDNGSGGAGGLAGPNDGGAHANGGGGGGGGANGGPGGAGGIPGGGGGGGELNYGGTAGKGVGVGGQCTVTYNSPPGAPSQDSPTDTQSGVSVTPVFQMTADDPDSDNVSYSVTIYSDACSTQIQHHDQASGETGWGSNASCTNPPTNCYSDNSQGSFTLQSADALSNSITYYWKAAAKDPDGSGNWATSTTCYSFTTASADSLTLIVDTDNFSPLTPGTPRFATSTVSVDTNKSTGWYVTLERVDADTTLDLDTDDTVNITDKTEWIAGDSIITESSQPATTITSGQDFLAFRVMTASSTNGSMFFAPTWWGSDDTPFTNAKWAGIASSTATTANKKIGISSVSSGGSPALNTVLYYLDAPNTQKTGAYSGNIIFTAAMN